MWIDLLVVLMIGGGIYRGWLSGFTQQFWSSAGFITGLLIGRLISPYTLGLADSSQNRTLITLATFLGSALFFLTIGEYIGLKLKHRLKGGHIHKADNAFGSVISVAGTVLGVWLIAALISGLPYTGLKDTIRSSHIISGLNRALPPAPGVIASLGKLIDPNGFPDVFIGSEPIPKDNVNLPELGDFQTIVNTTKPSVVRIKGQGCGGIVTGSGFVADSGLVATNAHVVAGIGAPYVEDSNGTHKSKVIWFDPDLDFAVLRTTGLVGKPLNMLAGDVNSETPAVILGYPGGGDFNAGPGVVLDKINARGRDIYGKGDTLRQVYEVKGTVVPGNSGGPLIDKNGNVIGVIFAESTSHQQLGYALATPKVISDLSQARTRTAAASTGQCAE